MKKISARVVEAVYEQLVDSVRNNLTDDLLKPQFKGQPFPMGHCYVAAEAIYHLAGGKESGLKPVRLRMPDGVVHWWLQAPDGEIIDPTHDQFAEAVPYEQGRPGGFLTREPSRRAQELINRVKGGPKVSTKIELFEGEYALHGGGYPFFYFIKNDILAVMPLEAYHIDLVKLLPAQLRDQIKDYLGETTISDDPLWVAGRIDPDEGDVSVYAPDMNFDEQIKWSDLIEKIVKPVLGSEIPLDRESSIKIARTTMYHVAPTSLRGNILQDGLKNNSIYWDNTGDDVPQALFFMDTPQMAEAFAKAYKPYDDYDVWAADVTDIPLHLDRLNYAHGPVRPFFTTVSVPPTRLHLMYTFNYGVGGGRDYDQGLLEYRKNRGFGGDIEPTSDDTDYYTPYTGMNPLRGYEQQRESKIVNLPDQFEPHAHDDDSRRTYVYVEPLDTLFLAPNNAYHNDIFQWIYDHYPQDRDLSPESLSLGFIERSYEDHALETRNYYEEGEPLPDHIRIGLEKLFGETVYNRDWEYPVDWRYVDDMADPREEEPTKQWPEGWSKDEGIWPSSANNSWIHPEHGYNKKDFLPVTEGGDGVAYVFLNDQLYIAPNSYHVAIYHWLKSHGFSLEDMENGTWGYFNAETGEMYEHSDAFNRNNWVKVDLDKYLPTAIDVTKTASNKFSGTQPIEVMIGPRGSMGNDHFYKQLKSRTVAWAYKEGTLYIGAYHKDIIAEMRREGLQPLEDSLFGWIWEGKLDIATDFGVQDESLIPEVEDFFARYPVNTVLNYARTGEIVAKTANDDPEIVVDGLDLPDEDTSISYVYDPDQNKLVISTHGGLHAPLIKRYLYPERPQPADRRYEDIIAGYGSYNSGWVNVSGNAKLGDWVSEQVDHWIEQQMHDYGTQSKVATQLEIVRGLDETHGQGLPFVYVPEHDVVYIADAQSFHTKLIRHSPDLRQFIDPSQYGWSAAGIVAGRVDARGDVEFYELSQEPTEEQKQIVMNLFKSNWSTIQNLAMTNELHDETNINDDYLNPYNEDWDHNYNVHNSSIQMIDDYQPEGWGGSDTDTRRPVIYDPSDGVAYVGAPASSHAETLRHVPKFQQLIEESDGGYGWIQQEPFKSLGYYGLITESLATYVEHYIGPEMPQEEIDELESIRPTANVDPYDGYMDWSERKEIGARPAIKTHDGTLYVGEPDGTHPSTIRENGLDWEDVAEVGVIYADGKEWWMKWSKTSAKIVKIPGEGHRFGDIPFVYVPSEDALYMTDGPGNHSTIFGYLSGTDMDYSERRKLDPKDMIVGELLGPPLSGSIAWEQGDRDPVVAIYTTKSDVPHALLDTLIQLWPGTRIVAEDPNYQNPSEELIPGGQTQLFSKGKTAAMRDVKWLASQLGATVEEGEMDEIAGKQVAPYLIMPDGTRVQIGVTVSPAYRRGSTTIVLWWIKSVPEGTGAGTKVMNALKALADAKGYDLQVHIAADAAKSFYRRFDWLDNDTWDGPHYRQSALPQRGENAFGGTHGFVYFDHKLYMGGGHRGLFERISDDMNENSFSYLFHEYPMDLGWIVKGKPEAFSWDNWMMANTTPEYRQEMLDAVQSVIDGKTQPYRFSKMALNDIKVRDLELNENDPSLPNNPDWLSFFYDPASRTIWIDFDGGHHMHILNRLNGLGEYADNYDDLEPGWYTVSRDYLEMHNANHFGQDYDEYQDIHNALRDWVKGLDRKPGYNTKPYILSKTAFRTQTIIVTKNGEVLEGDQRWSHSDFIVRLRRDGVDTENAMLAWLDDADNSVNYYSFNEPTPEQINALVNRYPDKELVEQNWRNASAKTAALMDNRPWNDPAWLKQIQDKIDQYGYYGDHVELYAPQIPFLVLEDGRSWIGWDAMSHAYEWMVEEAEQDLQIDYNEMKTSQGAVNFAGNEYQVHWPSHGLYRELEPQIVAEVLRNVEQQRETFFNRKNGLYSKTAARRLKYITTKDGTVYTDEQSPKPSHSAVILMHGLKKDDIVDAGIIEPDGEVVSLWNYTFGNGQTGQELYEKDWSYLAKTAGTTFYHAAPTASRESILENGLQPSRGEYKELYFFQHEHQAREFVENYRRMEPMDIWQVNMPTDIPLNVDEQSYPGMSDRDPDKGTLNPRPFYITYPISPDRLTLLTGDTTSKAYRMYAHNTSNYSPTPHAPVLPGFSAYSSRSSATSDTYLTESMLSASGNTGLSDNHGDPRNGSTMRESVDLSLGEHKDFVTELPEDFKGRWIQLKDGTYLTDPTYTKLHVQMLRENNRTPDDIADIGMDDESWLDSLGNYYVYYDQMENGAPMHTGKADPHQTSLVGYPRGYKGEYISATDATLKVADILFKQKGAKPNDFIFVLTNDGLVIGDADNQHWELMSEAGIDRDDIQAMGYVSGPHATIYANPSVSEDQVMQELIDSGYIIDPIDKVYSKISTEIFSEVEDILPTDWNVVPVDTTGFFQDDAPHFNKQRPLAFSIPLRTVWYGEEGRHHGQLLQALRAQGIKWKNGPITGLGVYVDGHVPHWAESGLPDATEAVIRHFSQDTESKVSAVTDHPINDSSVPSEAWAFTSSTGLLFDWNHRELIKYLRENGIDENNALYGWMHGNTFYIFSYDHENYQNRELEAQCENAFQEFGMTRRRDMEERVSKESHTRVVADTFNPQDITIEWQTEQRNWPAYKFVYDGPHKLLVIAGVNYWGDAPHHATLLRMLQDRGYNRADATVGLVEHGTIDMDYGMWGREPYPNWEEIGHFVGQLIGHPEYPVENMNTPVEDRSGHLAVAETPKVKYVALDNTNHGNGVPWIWEAESNTIYVGEGEGWHAELWHSVDPKPETTEDYEMGRIQVDSGAPQIQVYDDSGLAYLYPFDAAEMTDQMRLVCGTLSDALEHKQSASDEIPNPDPQKYLEWDWRTNRYAFVVLPDDKVLFSQEGGSHQSIAVDHGFGTAFEALPLGTVYGEIIKRDGIWDIEILWDNESGKDLEAVKELALNAFMDQIDIESHISRIIDLGQLPLTRAEGIPAREQSRSIAFASDGQDIYIGESHPDIVRAVVGEGWNDAKLEDWVFGWAVRIGPDDLWHVDIVSGNYNHVNDANRGYDEKIKRQMQQYLNGGIESHKKDNRVTGADGLRTVPSMSIGEILSNSERNKFSDSGKVLVQEDDRPPISMWERSWFYIPSQDKLILAPQGSGHLEIAQEWGRDLLKDAVAGWIIKDDNPQGYSINYWGSDSYGWNEIPPAMKQRIQELIGQELNGSDKLAAFSPHVVPTSQIEDGNGIFLYDAGTNILYIASRDEYHNELWSQAKEDGGGDYDNLYFGYITNYRAASHHMNLRPAPKEILRYINEYMQTSYTAAYGEEDDTGWEYFGIFWYSPITGLLYQTETGETNIVPSTAIGDITHVRLLGYWLDRISIDQVREVSQEIQKVSYPGWLFNNEGTGELVAVPASVEYGANSDYEEEALQALEKVWPGIKITEAEEGMNQWNSPDIRAVDFTAKVATEVVQVPQVDASESYDRTSRKPFIYTPQQDKIYIGPYGAHHHELIWAAFKLTVDPSEWATPEYGAREEIAMTIEDDPGNLGIIIDNEKLIIYWAEPQPKAQKAMEALYPDYTQRVHGWDDDDPLYAPNERASKLLKSATNIVELSDIPTLGFSGRRPFVWDSTNDTIYIGPNRSLHTSIFAYLNQKHLHALQVQNDPEMANRFGVGAIMREGLYSDSGITWWTDLGLRPTPEAIEALEDATGEKTNLETITKALV